MALYSASELRSKISHGKRDMREFDPKVGKLYHIWIPKNALYYVKKHFNIHSVPVAKHCRIKAVTCINTDPDAPKRKCPICDYIQELWETWRKETDKKEKKKIQTTINSLSAEYIYVNAIDTNDADLKFVALRLTKGLLENFVMATQDTPVENIIWQFKKMDKNGKIEYTFLESPNDPKAIELCKDYETLAAREFADGGLVDLEAALAYDTTEKKYIELLTGEEQEDDDSDEEAPKKPAVSKPKAAAKPKVEIEDDDSLSLDDIDMDEEEKPKAKPAEKPKAAVKEEEDDLELSDDLGLDEEETKPETNKKAATKPAAKKVEEEISLDDDDLSLDDLDLEELGSADSSTNIEVDAAFLNENKGNRAYVDQIIEALVTQKKIKKTDNHVENLKAAYAVMKKNNLKVTIDEIPF